MQTYSNPYGEYGNTSVALNYMQHLPYIDTLWFGEGFNTGPSVSKEHWLVEQSGVLFGMFSEMLAGPNLWKGALFGETGRAPAVNMKPLYAMWDSVNLPSMTICGWWNTTKPVACHAHTSDKERVPLTTYSCPDCSASHGPAAVFAIASFATTPVNVSIVANWTALGFDIDSVRLHAPEIENFQPSFVFNIDDRISLSPSQQGWMLVVESSKG